MREKSYSKNDIKNISRQILGAYDLGSAGVHHAEETKTEIENAIQAVSYPEGMRALKKIPIEELNARKSGIRINLLKDAGYSDMHAVFSASPEKLASVHGIGDVMAYRAKEIANAVASEVCNSVKLKLSLDHKTEEYSRLVVAVAEHMRAKSILPMCKTVLSMLPPDPKAELKKLDCGSNGIKWFFAGDTKKATANASYAKLSGVASDLASSGILPKIARSNPITIAEAWNDYAKRPVEYYHVLEEIAPDRFDSTEDGYGLSDEIRESVENTPVDLTGLKCTLRGYQIWGVKYILHQKKVLLGDEMGLGKTIQALAAMVSLRNGVPAKAVAPAPAQPTAEAAVPATATAVQPAAPAPVAAEKPAPKRFLVICPASVIVNWCREVEGKSDLKAYNMHDAYRDGAFAAWAQKGGVAVTNYESLENRFAVEDDFSIDMIIVDEAHYIKNTAAKRSQNVLRLCAHTDRILFMTGTPLENRVEEMVGLMDHLQHDVAQTAKTVSVTAYADDFKKKISPVYYRRRRNDVLSELPELTDIKEWCDMTPEDEAAYENDVLGGSFMDVRRVSWRNSDYLNTSAKVQRLREIVEDAADDARKVLVFSFFLDTLEKIQTIFGEKCIGVINGAVPVEERQNIVDAFEAAPAGSVLAAQIQSGGTGLNIQSASVVVLCEPQYKPSTENQAIGRAHRMGQTRDVMVHRLLCPDTVDERMLELVEAKQAEFDTFADESTAAMRDASLEKSGVDVNQGVVVGESKEASEVKAPSSENAPERELDTATLNKIFEDEKARIRAKHESAAQTAKAAPVAPAQTAPQPVAQQAAPAPTPAAPQKLFCRMCGRELPVDSVFCSYCGCRLHE
ncbi:MAG: RNA helicase [Clostridiales bacterium]|nr:RNA helicase [Clostridiales bacterium]MBP5492994.1 RNA helicase [Clostridiales bacterium]